ncbi:UNVERIFIED_CONTAM: putative LRR receptor-like serine/threonine-protein kinase [Sesamum latifolium]|uniref:non-specific serine/threonine protein kinase n=1 Tax=Sesamum latifolium TaxID=2727402 RepID=A0AAW2TRL3_9LAMI
MAPAPPLMSRRRLLVLCFLVAIGQLMDTAGAQNGTTTATTDPLEARALNAMFARWGISATNTWNVSGELCSGVAIDDTEIVTFNPGIKCNCTYNNRTTCHITSLRVNELDVTGPIPDELWNLTYMDYLDLSRNYLTGLIPASIDILNRLQYLSFRENALSGVVPRELGLLTDLRSLSFNRNNFSGPLPAELGNLSRLTQLRFQGNSFQGLLPPSFSSLTSLHDLRITELSNGFPSLDFLRNMSSLSTLVLRNNNISGPIPSFLGELPRLALLDLSFNNLTGTIPNSLFNHMVLTNLFLGNNRLTGAMPSQKSPTLRNIDLSYNELSGSFPSWVSEQNLQLDLQFGLNCLQRNFPCNRGAPVYSSFAINCAGLQIVSSDEIVYESDNETLGPATHYVTPTRKWAVSNVGLPADTGSLRYYGLGLENGNYTVRLLFAETIIIGTRTWESIGRRVFDIYVQGNRVEKDFDILREANGTFLRAVVKEFKVQVSENYIDIHFFWAGKGTCCSNFNGTYGPLVSAISATSDSRAAVSENLPGGNKNRTGLIVGITVAVAAAILLSLAATYYVFRKRKMQKQFEDEVFSGFDVKPCTFSYAELKTATRDFNVANKLGEGGFGPVYKGTVEDGRVVAVKQLSVASRQGKNEFLAEIATISAVQHRNLVKLYGCCVEGDKRLLVYEYLENKSLDQLLFGAEGKSLYLDWATRYDVCLGVARGLAYLHEESRVRIVHRDVKASNILLDSDLTPKISDFGLAKLYEDSKTHISTRIAGTVGYVAPEYAILGRLTEKADTFSFGVVALEIISGRPNSDLALEDDKMYLLKWVWILHEDNRDIELVDPTLHQYDANAVQQVIDVALLCTQASPALRPSMSRVVAMLSGDVEVPSVISKPGYLTDWNFSDVTTFITSTMDASTSKSNTSYMNSTTGNTTPTDYANSLENTANPILHQRIGSGR